MPTYRLTVRRTEISHEVIEVQAVSARDAAVKGGRYADEVSGARRGVTIVATYDEDPKGFERRDVIAVKEV